MSAENIYEYLCGLERAIDEMESIIHDRESRIDDLHLRMANAEMAALAARRESEDFAAKISRDAQRYIEVEVQARLDAAVNDRIDSLIRHERQKFEQELEAFKAQLMADAEAAALAESAAASPATSHAPKFQKSARKSVPQIDLFTQTLGADSPDPASTEAPSTEAASIQTETSIAVITTAAALPPALPAVLPSVPPSAPTAQNTTKQAAGPADWGKTHKVANDASALILADKLDSTIDKVQRLLREAAG